MQSDNFKIKFIDSISKIERAQWDHLINTDYPFIQYEFLLALENSGCVCASTGWQPKHLVAYDRNRLVGFMPLYLKTHSYGEYVFDFQWAHAYQQSGLSYYPKLLTAIPFTPCSGTRMIVSEEYGEALSQLIISALIKESENLRVSSYHLLFPHTHHAALYEQETKLQRRVGMQYHWYNKNYSKFDDFLALCKMKQRKNIKRERKAIAESNIDIKIIKGADISEQLWSDFFYFYQLTYAKRSGNSGYLNQDFFTELGTTMPESIIMIVAEISDKTIAISLFFKDSKTLYGRYWGTNREIEYLHFELCYYQGIEYCINNGLIHFDAGAQGEHKIQRGFEPIETYSYHWIKDEQFSGAINNFLLEEKKQIKYTIQDLSNRLPYKT